MVAGFIIRHNGCSNLAMILGVSRKLLPRRSCEAGFTFVENLIAMVIVVLFFSALYGLNSQALYLLNSGREALVANVCLRDRVEQLRNCTWTQLTDSTYLRTSVLNSSPSGAANLGNLTETLTINSYPAAGNPPISLTRTNGSASCHNNQCCDHREHACSCGRNAVMDRCSGWPIADASDFDLGGKIPMKQLKLHIASRQRVQFG